MFRLSIANDMKKPAFAATAEVITISRQTNVVVPGVKIAKVTPFAGRVLYVRAPSVQVLSSTCLKFSAPPEPFVTNIRSVADVALCPASERKSNFRYDSRTGWASERRSGARLKKLPGRSPST